MKWWIQKNFYIGIQEIVPKEYVKIFKVHRIGGLDLRDQLEQHPHFFGKSTET